MDLKLKWGVCGLCRQQIVVPLRSNGNVECPKCTRLDLVRMSFLSESSWKTSHWRNDPEIRPRVQVSLSKLKFAWHSIWRMHGITLTRVYWCMYHFDAGWRCQVFDVILIPLYAQRESSSLKIFVWSGLQKQAGAWAKQCIPCQASKVHTHIGTTRKIIHPSALLWLHTCGSSQAIATI